jgi:lysophospholipase L1-like esterase
LARLDRDALSVPGTKYIVLLEGINDIGASGPGTPFGDFPLADPKALIAAYSQVIARAHERGIKVIGATMLPFEGAMVYTIEKEPIRAEVNQWIRSSNSFDGIVDFDAAVRDSTNPKKFDAAYDSGDHLHPNAAGYRKMGEAIDLKLFN